MSRFRDIVFYILCMIEVEDMAINMETLSRMKKYIFQNDVADVFKADALSIIDKIVNAENENTCKIATECSESICKMPTIVGFDEAGNAVCWDMMEGSVLASADTGVAMNYTGFSTAVVSAIFNYSVDEFQYYLATDELAPKFLREDEHCITYTTAFGKAQTTLDEILNSIDKEVKNRKTLSQDKLKKEPFLLVAFGNLCHFDVDYKKYENLFKSIIEKGARLKIACYVATSRLHIEPICKLCKFAHVIVSQSILDGRYIFSKRGYEKTIWTHHVELGSALSSHND